jgi:hypothetical protein
LDCNGTEGSYDSGLPLYVVKKSKNGINYRLLVGKQDLTLGASALGFDADPIVHG